MVSSSGLSIPATKNAMGLLVDPGSITGFRHDCVRVTLPSDHTIARVPTLFVAMMFATFAANCLKSTTLLPFSASLLLAHSIRLPGPLR